MGKLSVTIDTEQSLVKVLTLHKACLAELREHVVTLRIESTNLKANQERLERLQEQCGKANAELKLTHDRLEILQNQRGKEEGNISWQQNRLREAFHYFEEQAKATSAKLSNRLTKFLHGLHSLDLDNKVASK